MYLNKKPFSIILKIIISLLIMILAIQFLVPANFSTNAFEFEMSIKPCGSGRTFIHFPPFGKIIVATHLPPIDFHLTLKSINLDEITEFASSFSQAGFRPEKVIQEIKISMVKYAIFLLILSFLLGMAAMLFWRHRDKTEILRAGFCNSLVLFIAIMFTIFTYNTEAFSKVEYEGVLEAAPWVLSVFHEGIDVVENLGGQFTEIVENISFLQREMDKNAALTKGKDGKRILHVSDIHNNPAAFDFIRRIADTFEVEIIIDTGDLIDYGTSLETELFSQYLSDFAVPYVFIPGNHDSPFLVEELKKNEAVIVLEEGIVEIAGLKIAGIADPASYSASNVISDEVTMEETAQKIAKIACDSEGIDIIAAHHPDCFKYLRNNNNVLLGGHLHKPYIKKTDSYLEINAGTTGSSGVRGLKNMEIDFSLILLDFQYSEIEEAYIPSSADLIKVKQFPLNFSFERFLFSD